MRLVNFHIKLSMALALCLMLAAGQAWAAFPTTSVIDNFNRSNEGPPPSASWGEWDAGLKVVSNRAVGNDGTNHNYWNGASSDYTDVEVYTTIVTSPASLDQVCLTARFNYGTYSGYLIQWSKDYGLYLHRWVSGGDTTIQTDAGEFANGDSIGMSVVGSDPVVITIYKKASGGSWASVFTYSDSNANRITASGKIGLRTLGTTATLDDFGGGTYTPDTTPPVRSAGAPSGSLTTPGATKTLSLTTDENATCKYSTTANTSYGDMTLTFSGTTTTHTKLVSTSNGTTYNYYVRCIDADSNANTTDYPLTFTTWSAYYIDPTCANNGNGIGPDCASGSGTLGAFNVSSSIAALDAADYQQGYIYLKRGTLTRGVIHPNTSSTNYIIDAYGSGALPRLNGTAVVALSGWDDSEAPLYFKASTADRWCTVTTKGGVETLLVRAANKAAMVAGTMWWDDPNGRLYVYMPDGLAPSTATSIEWTDAALTPVVSLHDGCTLQNINVQYASGNLVAGSGQDIIVRNNNIEHGLAANVTIIPPTAKTGIKVEDNYISDSGNNCMEFQYLTAPEIRRNRGVNCGGLTTGELPGNFIELWQYVTDAIIEHNYSNGCFYSGVWLTPVPISLGENSGIVIRNNVFLNSYHGSIRVETGTGNKIYNNTIYGVTGTGGGHGGIVVKSAAGVDIKNNIVVVNGVNDPTWIYQVDSLQTAAGTTVTGDNNIWRYIDLTGNQCSGLTVDCAQMFPYAVWNGVEKTTLAAFKTAAGAQFQNDISADPLLTATYGLGAGSPAIDAGTPVFTAAQWLANGDFAGNHYVFGAGPDIGAFEKKKFIFDSDDEQLPKKCKTSNAACYVQP